MASKQDYIAVFDSGVGGISVLKRMLSVMPGERYLYYGDSANAPYGDRPAHEILALTSTAVEKIMTRPVKALVVACNTATAVAVDYLRKQYPNTIVVGIEPALKPAADRFPGGTVGLLSTSATLKTDRVARLMASHADRCRFLPLPAPELAPLVEQGKGTGPEAEEILRKLLRPHMGELNALVLGCTHYPFAVPAIRRIVGEEMHLFDGGIGTAVHTKELLSRASLLENGSGELIWENSLEDPALFARCRELLEQPLEG